jgi:serine protease
MACPHVAGWVALMLGENPALTPVDIDDLIRGGEVSIDLGTRGRDDDFGYGLIDAAAAVAVARDYAGGTPVAIPELGLSPDQVMLGPTQSRARVTGANIGDGSLAIASVSVEAAWLRVESVSAGVNEVAFEVVVDRSQLGQPGVYEANVVLETSKGIELMPVMAVVRALGEPAALGPSHALLVDAAGDVVASAVSRDGRYRLEPALAGDYVMVGGTDLDNDGRLCGRGEACGRYPSLEAPQVIAVGQSERTDVDVVIDWLFQSALDYPRP